MNQLMRLNLGEKGTSKKPRPIAGRRVNEQPNADNGSEGDNEGEGGGGDGSPAPKRYTVKHLSSTHLQRQVCSHTFLVHIFLHVLQIDVRYHYLQILAGFAEDYDPSELGILTPPSSEELAAFEQGETGGPTLQNFRLDLREKKERSEWNRCAAKIFARSYLKQNFMKQQRKAVEKSFVSHIRSIRVNYLKQIDPKKRPSASELDRKRIARRLQRKRTVSLFGAL